MKKIKIADFDIASISNQFTLEKIEEIKKQAEEVKLFYPCEVIVSITEQDEKDYFEKVEIMLIHPLEINIHFDGYKKKWHMYCRKFNELKNITHNTIDACKQNLAEPKNIGVLNTIKIFNWINYYDSLYNLLKEKDAENASRKKAFMQSISGLDVVYSQDGKAGKIKTNGIIFSFHIHETHIDKYIELEHINSTIENFLKLSDNKF